MAETRDFGKTHYWHLAWYPPRPLVDTTVTTEIDAPFRIGKSLVLRIPFTRIAIVIGKWHSSHPDEDSAILSAIQGREYVQEGK